MCSKNNILLGISVIGAFLCSFNSFAGFRAIVAICLLFLAFSDKFFLTYPIALFFYTQFGLFAGLSILRLFSLLLVLNCLVLYREKRENKEFNLCFSDIVFVCHIFCIYNRCVDNGVIITWIVNNC